VSLRIEDYALIGDCQAAALVGRNGSIDWLCWPSFDSPACFAALLGKPEHGHWRISPAGEAKARRRYRPDTLVLETELANDHGTVKLVDFMPVGESDADLVRIVVGTRGRMAMSMQLVLRFDYGSFVPWVSRFGDGRLRAIAGPDMVILDTPVDCRGEGLSTAAEFEVREGESVSFVLMRSPSHLPPPGKLDVQASLERTERFWRGWIGRCRASGPAREAVRRSLITLKALTYAPTGAMVAAPTTSLPEKPGGERNWDYRYCWLRDATLTLLAFMDAGYFEEAEAFREWLVRAAAGSPEQMQIMYGISGERRLREWHADWLPGYEASVPVRIGNAAALQLQLDVYGELIDALHQGRRGGLKKQEEAWDVQRALLEHLESVWQEPDAGIWEVRGAPRHFTYSKIMCWVAFDRAVKAVERFGLDGPLERWKRLRARIHEDVCRRGYDAGRNTFVQSYGSQELDASLLLIPHMGFLPADDPRMRGTVAAIERELMRDGFVLRYRTERADDGLPAGEGAFLACSFWLADNYLLQGRTGEARELFERLVGLTNDVGLLAEQYDPHAKRQLGNFPQAFSHVALINTAFNLSERVKPAQERGA
jgi:GH15 family glucan-1,4-alpha-glucosidase